MADRHLLQGHRYSVTLLGCDRVVAFTRGCISTENIDCKITRFVKREQLFLSRYPVYADHECRVTLSYA
ncbi:hypothetical protein Q4488_17865 [Amphritea sp. 1_MG-2023]|uniref:hypothetical protein n=1 Tax=Amphritea sp. 1_MG-2023 TaxID=3062670 RepID=UPI0026E2D160|nr:hypothetical protein [Amphritea sp. 1_MG-2023]MDO6565244.1 hypothetical protein [Amphritea sp. 1_MG-2023]